jgi:hypothetical protein
MVFEINYKLFRKGVSKVIQVSLNRATPWYEYRLGLDGLVRKMECNVVVDTARVKAASVCREVDKSKSFILLPVLIIEPSGDVLTVVTVD